MHKIECLPRNFNEILIYGQIYYFPFAFPFSFLDLEPNSPLFPEFGQQPDVTSYSGKYVSQRPQCKLEYYIRNPPEFGLIQKYDVLFGESISALAVALIQPSLHSLLHEESTPLREGYSCLTRDFIGMSWGNGYPPPIIMPNSTAYYANFSIHPHNNDDACYETFVFVVLWYVIRCTAALVTKKVVIASSIIAAQTFLIKYSFQAL